MAEVGRALLGLSETAGSPHRARARWRLGRAAIALVLLVLAFVALPVLHSIGRLTAPRGEIRQKTKAAVAGPPAGTHLVFAASFTGTALDKRVWSTCYPWVSPTQGCTNYGNNELEWYLPSQDIVSGGALHLIAERAPTAGHLADGAAATYSWRSGMVTTYKSFAFTYGYIVLKARASPGYGLWSAMWLLPKNGDDLPEIDVAEVWGANTKHIGRYYHLADGTRFDGSGMLGDETSEGWHTFALDWEPGSMTWYTDGRVSARFTGTVPSIPMYLLANLAVDGKPGSDPTAATPSPDSLDIQSVEVYQH